MPKISIREIDNTGTETLQYDDYCVLVPGIKFECSLPDHECIGTLDGHYTTFEAFKKALNAIFSHQTLESGSPSIAAGFQNDLGFITACECLRNGLTVQYVGAYSLPNGADLTEESGGADYEGLFDEYTDKGKYDIRFISCGGLKSDLAKIAALNAAAKRGDAKAVLDVNEEFTFNSQEYVFTGTSGQFTEAIEEWLDESTIKDACGETVTRTGTSGSDWTVTETIGRYGQLFAPSTTIKIHLAQLKQDDDGKLYVEFKSTVDPVSVPASLIYLTTFGKHVITGTKKYNPWYAISGSVRGKSPYTYLVPSVDFGDADVDVLQVRSGSDNEGHVATNVIANIRPYGYVIWGSRSMQPLSKPESDTGDLAVQLTAASFANIRELCTSIKKTLYRSGRRFSFEPNSDELWFNFKATITPLLEKMKDNGIRGYNIVKERTNKKALVMAKVEITPIEPVEDFDLTVEMSDTLDTVVE